MKKIFQLFLVTGLTIGILKVAEAQRGRSQRGFSSQGNRSSGAATRFDGRSRGNVVPVRTFNGNSGNSFRGASQRGSRTITGTSRLQNNGISRSASGREFGANRNPLDRSIVSRQGYNRSSSFSRSNTRYNYNNRRFSNNNNNSFYRSHYIQRPVFMYGPRYTVIPRGSISIHFGGDPYYYQQGYFYGYYGGYYQPVFPPFGLRIDVLPFGYSRFYVGADPFFYYNGIYYRQYDDNNYEVVDAPLGATVSSLPRGAKSVVLNGEKLYELNGTYYQSGRNSKGKKEYTVIGKNGEVNNNINPDFNPDMNNNDENINNNNVDEARGSLKIGDLLDTLPDNSKIVTINGEQMYVTPENSYLKEETVDGRIKYRVIGN